MKHLCLTLTLITCGLLNAQEPVPGTQRVDRVFNEADVVCICKTVVMEIQSEEALQKPPNVLRHMRAIIEVEDVFKPATLQPGERLTVRFAKEFPGASRGDLPSLQPSKTAILFLKKAADGSYEFSDKFIGASHFKVLPKASGGSGLARLESVLLNILEQAPPGGPYHDDLRALYMLEGFPTLSPEGTSHMARLANSPDPDIALAAIGTLLKTKRPQNVELLRHHLDNYQGDKEPTSVWSVGAYLREIRDPEALPSLESLSGSRFTSVQLGAMDALRKIRSPSSAPALIQRLDDSNKVVRYQAVMTLAETFGKDREFAPSMELFDQDPERYVSAWKLWWSQQPRIAPRPTKKPDILKRNSRNP